MALPTHDLASAIAFYRDVLELPFIWSNAHLAFFQLGATRLLLEVPESEAFDHPGSVLYFDVEDIEAAVPALEARGAVFEDDPHMVGDLGQVSVWMAFFRDPAGNLLALPCERPHR